MASLLNWAKKRVRQVENIIGNDVIDPIQRDVLRPVGHIASEVPGFAYHNVVEPIAQTAVQAPIDIANTAYNRVIAPSFNLPNLTPIQTKPISGLSRRVGATGSLHQTLSSSAQLAAMLATGGIAGGIEKGIGITAPKLAGTIVPRIASNAALGAGFNALAATAQGAKPKDIAKSAAIGGALGGAIPVAGAGVKLGAKGVVKLNNNRLPLNDVGAVGKNIKPPSLSGGKSPKPPLTDKNIKAVELQAGQASVQKANMIHGKTPSMTARVMQNPLTPPEVSKNIGGHYIVKPNKQTLAKATAEINANPEAATARILGPQYKPTVHNHAVAMLLAEKARVADKPELMTSLLERVGNEASNPGQAIQILSQWGKSTPTGIVKYAQKVVREGHKLPDGTPTKVLTPDQAKTFGNRMEQIQKLPEGRNKNLQTAVLIKDIHSLSPPSAGSKLQNLLYYAQLLNPKTAIRNIGGNAIFGGAENVSDLVAAPVDKLTSAITGRGRQVYAPDLYGQLRAGVKGAKEAYQEAKLGVNLSGTTGQFEAYGRPPVFNNKVGRFLDKALAVELSVPDRFALSGAQYQSLKNQLRASGVDKKLLTPDKIWAAKLGKDVGVPITQDMLERAGQLGKYRTFQDNSVPAGILQGLKKTLNYRQFGGKFGGGSFVMNYPKTPGNLLARGLDFSPAGFIKTAIELAKPAFGKGFNQEQFVRSLSRTLTGSVGLVGTGAALNQLGIITGRPDPSKNANQAQKLLGLGQYKINVSALKRFIASGFSPSAAKLRPGDTQVSYDWAQPASFALTMGANINQTKGTNKGTVAKISNSLGKGAGEIVDAMNSLAEQPVLQGLQTLTGSSGAGLTQGLIQTAASAPSGFVPTLFNQINQVLNNTSRSTYSPNPLVSGVKKVEAKIPGVASSLQPQVNILGQPAERYQKGTNNLFNVFLNPAFVSKYIPNKVLDETNRLENATGETSQFPKQIKYTQKVNGKNVPLTPQQVTQLQTYIGQKASDQLGKIIDSPSYQKATDTEKVNMLSSTLTNISQAGRAVVLGNKSKLGSNARAVANNQDIILGGASSPKEKYQQALDTFNRDQSTYSGVKKDKEQQKLSRLKIQTSYSQDVLDLYGESKAKTYQYITTHNDGKKLASQLQAYDQALYNAGLTSYLKYKNGLAPSSKGYGRAGGSKSRKTPFSTTGFKTASKVKISQPKGIKVKKLAYKSSAKPKKLSVKKIPSNYLNKKLG